MRRSRLAKMIDQTLLRPVPKAAEFDAFVSEALARGVGQICVAGSEVAKLKDRIGDRDRQTRKTCTRADINQTTLGKNRHDTKRVE